MREYSYLFSFGCKAVIGNTDTEYVLSSLIHTLPFKITNKENMKDASMELRAEVYDSLLSKYHVDRLEIKQFKLLSFSLLEEEEVK